MRTWIIMGLAALLILGEIAGYFLPPWLNPSTPLSGLAVLMLATALVSIEAFILSRSNPRKKEEVAPSELSPDHGLMQEPLDVKA